MYLKLTIRISDETYKILKQEAAELGLTFGEFVRGILDQYQMEENSDSSKRNQDTTNNSKTPESLKTLHPLLLENNLLLRKMARHINSQIVRETDEEIEYLLKRSKE